MTQRRPVVFNPPPEWPKPPEDWIPPNGWKPDPAWPDPPPGWQLWIPGETPAGDRVFDSGSDPFATIQKSRVESESSPTSMDQRLALLEAENAALRAHFESIGTVPNNVVVLDDERVLQDVGIYRYHHPLENALAYRERLDDIAARIAEMIKGGPRSISRTCSPSMARWQRGAR